MAGKPRAWELGMGVDLSIVITDRKESRKPDISSGLAAERGTVGVWARPPPRLFGQDTMGHHRHSGFNPEEIMDRHRRTNCCFSIRGNGNARSPFGIRILRAEYLVYWNRSLTSKMKIIHLDTQQLVLTCNVASSGAGSEIMRSEKVGCSLPCGFPAF